MRSNQSKIARMSPKVQRLMQAAERINERITLGHTIKYQSPVESLPPMTFPVEGAYVAFGACIDDSSMLIEAGPYGDIAVAPEHFHFFSWIDLQDLAKAEG
jgi:hypothetical protein